MVELLLMDETLTSNPALKLTFLEKAVSAWLKDKENSTVTMATPNQLHSVFKLIKAEYDERIVQDQQQNN